MSKITNSKIYTTKRKLFFYIIIKETKTNFAKTRWKKEQMRLYHLHNHAQNTTHACINPDFSVWFTLKHLNKTLVRLLPHSPSHQPSKHATIINSYFSIHLSRSRSTALPLPIRRRFNHPEKWPRQQPPTLPPSVSLPSSYHCLPNSLFPLYSPSPSTTSGPRRGS